MCIFTLCCVFYEVFSLILLVESWRTIHVLSYGCIYASCLRYTITCLNSFKIGAQKFKVTIKMGLFHTHLIYISLIIIDCLSFPSYFQIYELHIEIRNAQHTVDFRWLFNTCTQCKLNSGQTERLKNIYNTLISDFIH